MIAWQSEKQLRERRGTRQIQPHIPLGAVDVVELADSIVDPLLRVHSNHTLAFLHLLFFVLFLNPAVERQE